MKNKILITSATGKTGFPAAVQLLKEGYPIKILARSRNEKIYRLEKLGAEIVLGDFTNYEDMHHALHGVSRVYYCHPFIPNLLTNTKTFIKAAQETHVEAVVNMGQWLAEFDDQKSIHTLETKKAYSVFEQSGLNVVHVIPGFFADNTFFVLEFAIQLGLLPLPFGAGKNPAISNEDLGLVIASLLKKPFPYIGKKLRPTGPKSLSAKEMAEIFSKVAGRKVRYINIPQWMFLKAAFAFAKDFGLDAFTISQVRHYMNEYQTNKFNVGGVTDVVHQIAGKVPDDFEAIVERYMKNSKYSKQSFSKKISAIGKFLKIPFTHTPSIKDLERFNTKEALFTQTAINTL
ncbi:MAG: NmrA family NAD(P)-binding protein [Bacteroidota bacterium]|nr:NmrA family NAD(P)-binding protein [Bacteroidota bacterium]